MEARAAGLYSRSRARRDPKGPVGEAEVPALYHE